MSNAKNSYGLSMEVATNTQPIELVSQEPSSTPIQIPKTSGPDILKQQENKENSNIKHQPVKDAVPKLPGYLENLPYDDGQCSIKNPTGKKDYSKLFLIQLANEAVCQKKPDVFSASQLSSFVLNETVSELDSEIAIQINMKCKNFLLEYEELQNLDDIIYSVSEDKSSVIHTRHADFVKSMSLITLDCDLIGRSTVVGKIFTELLSKKIISIMAITQGIDNVLKDWNDYLMDYPQFFSYIAAIITPLLLSENTSFDFNNLKESCTSIRPDNSGNFFLEVLNKIRSSKKTQDINGHLCGILWIYNKWIMSEYVSLDMFMSHNQINKYFRNDPVGVFLLSIAIYDKMELTDDKLLFDVLHRWINNNISEEIIECHQFVRALTIAMVIRGLKQYHSCHKFDHQNTKLLVYYIRSATLSDLEVVAREVQCLYGVQIISAALENPEGMLLKLFHCLYQDSILSSESFVSWQKEDCFNEDLETKTMILKELKDYYFFRIEPSSSDEDYE